MLESNLRQIYGNILKNEGLAWRLLGFPIDDLIPKINLVSLLIIQIMISHVIHIKSALSTLEKTTFESHLWEQPLITLFESIRLISDTIYFIANGTAASLQLKTELAVISHSFIKASLESLNTLSTTSKNSMDFKKSKPHQTKITYFFQRIITVLECNKYDEGSGFELNTCSDSKSKSTLSSTAASSGSLNCEMDDYSFTPLLHIMIEAGLILAEFVGKDKPRNDALQQHLNILCARYVISVSNVVIPLLVSPTLDRLKVFNLY
jgi:hypothetical protein